MFLICLVLFEAPLGVHRLYSAIEVLFHHEIPLNMYNGSTRVCIIVVNCKFEQTFSGAQRCPILCDIDRFLIRIVLLFAVAHFRYNY